MKNAGVENIVNIKIGRLYPHPDNPRKDVGDVAELAESIRKNGIMQNLTVMPVSALKMDPDEQPEANEIALISDFYVLIGHRRLAASKLAGLSEVPCKIVSKISKKEQIGIMLEENMQRNDLTIYEQAQGFQMMLDLGETEETIADKTGFSKTTIRHRLNIAKLDQKLIRKKEQSDSFQLSLTDLYALEKIEDVETRNKVLNDASNHEQLIWKVNRAVQEAKEKKAEDAIVAKLKELGVKKATKKMENEIYTVKWSIVKEFSLSKEIPETITLKGKDLYYLRRYDSVAVIKENKKQAKQQTEYELKRKQVEANKKKINAKAKEAAGQMKEFTRKYVNNELHTAKEQPWYKEALWEMVLERGVCVSKDRIVGFLLNKNSWEVSGEDRESTKETTSKMKMFQQMLCCLMYDVPTELADYYGYYNQDKGGQIMAIYDFLMQLGFTFDDDEYERTLDGVHELYEVKEESKND